MGIINITIKPPSFSNVELGDLIYQMKKCNKCGEVKPLTEFYKSKVNKDGLSGSCKKCCCINSKKWQKNNPERYKEIRIKYQENNSEKIKEQIKKWQKDNPEKCREQNKEYRKNNPEKIKEKSKEYYKNNSEKVREKRKRRYQNNPEKEIEATVRWAKNNPDKVKENNKRWQENNIEGYKKSRRKTYAKLQKTPSYRINNAIKSGIWEALKGNKNGRHWEDLVGYTLEELMEHLESKFEPWMNWGNHGVYEEGKLKWQIDHIRPVSSFNFETPDDKEVKECWALSNLQPLEVIANIKKGNKKLCIK